jgi:hypothetical protein
VTIEADETIKRQSGGRTEQGIMGDWTVRRHGVYLYNMCKKSEGEDEGEEEGEEEGERLLAGSNTLSHSLAYNSKVENMKET